MADEQPPSLAQKIVGLHKALAAHDIAHAFGGALALAWCTQRARGTIDIDLNVFVDATNAEAALTALPEGVIWSASDVDMIAREGQQRIWWDQTPIDLFVNTMKLHEHMARRCRWETFAGESLPFLACQDLAVFKAFFNRTKDWADLEEMMAAGTLPVEIVVATMIEFLGVDDERVTKLQALRTE